MRPNEDFRRSFEDMEFLRLGGAKSVFYSQYLEELRPEGSGSSNLPILVEQRLGGVFWRTFGLEELRYGLEVNFWRSGDIWYLSEELRFGGAVVLIEIGLMFGAVQLGGVVTRCVAWNELGVK